MPDKSPNKTAEFELSLAVARHATLYPPALYQRHDASLPGGQLHDQADL